MHVYKASKLHSLCHEFAWATWHLIDAAAERILFNLMNIVLLIKLNSTTETNQFGIFNLQK